MSLAGLALLGGPPPAWAQGQGRSAGPVPGELGFIEQLYRAHDDYRAESEILRFLFNHPRDPRRDQAELLRAKLYYREGRYRDADVMLLSLLDRYPRGEAAPEARRLLAYSRIRQGRLAAAAQALAELPREEGAAPSLAPLQHPPPGTVDVGHAVAWSTVLPGSGFLSVGEPGKATAALALNLAFIGATVAAYQADLPGPALLFLLVEMALYKGQRQATREDAERLNRRLRLQQTEGWLKRHGEPALLGVGIRFRFGGG